MAALAASAGLAACTTTLHGQVSAGGATTSTGAGGPAVFSRGAAGVLMLGVMLADIVDQMAHGQGRASPGAAAASIADTCSCYRQQPEPVRVRARSDEPGERGSFIVSEP